MQSYLRDRKFLTILFSAFFYFVCIMMSTPVAQGYAVFLGASTVSSGIASGMLTIGSLAMRPFLGYFMNRFQRKLFGICGLVLMGASGLLSIVAPNPFSFLVCRVLTGFGFAICSVAFSTIVADILPHDKIGAGMSIYALAHAIAMAISPTLGLWLRDTAGYTAVFLCMAGCAAISMALAVLSGPIPNPPMIQPVGKARLSDILRGFYVKEVIPVALITLFTSMAYSAITSFLSAYARSLALPVSVTRYFPVYAIALFVLRLVFTKTLDQKPYGMFALLCVPSIIAALLALSAMKGSFLLYLAAVFMGFGYGMITTASQANCIKLVEPSRRGAANSCYYMGMDIGLTVGPFVAGGADQHLGSGSIFWVIIPFVALCFIVVCRNRKMMFSLPQKQ